MKATIFVRGAVLVIAAFILLAAPITPAHAELTSDTVIDTPGVTVVQRVTPNATVHRHGIVTFEIIIQSYRTDGTGNVTVSMPYNPSVLTILEATFSEPDAWVVQNQPGMLKFETGRLRQEQPLIATVRGYVLPGAPDGARVGDSVFYEWRNESGNYKHGRSNQPTLVVGESSTHQDHFGLSINPVRAPRGSALTLVSGPIFAPGEIIALWYDTPGDGPREIGRVAANPNGALHAQFTTGSVGDGLHYMVARGDWSGISTVGEFYVEPIP